MVVLYFRTCRAHTQAVRKEARRFLEDDLVLISPFLSFLSSSAIQYELGGKDAAYIRADADIDYCIDHLLFFALYNSGQNCYKAERFYGEDNNGSPISNFFSSPLLFLSIN